MREKDAGIFAHIAVCVANEFHLWTARVDSVTNCGTVESQSERRGTSVLAAITRHDDLTREFLLPSVEIV
jgi:hypothetical protein